MRIFRLINVSVRQAACKEVMAAPEGYVVRLSEATRSLEANAFLHATLTDVSDQMEWAGDKQDVETWKRLLVAAWMRATGRNVTLLPALDGQGFDALYQRTSKLSRSECAELSEFILAWCTDNDIKLREPYAEAI